MPRPVIRKVDDNQAQIVAALRRLGYSVRSTAVLSKGFPDIVFGKFGHNFLAEIKDGEKVPSARKLTPDEETFWREWKGSVVLLESVQDVIEFDRKRVARHSSVSSSETALTKD